MHQDVKRHPQAVKVGVIIQETLVSPFCKQERQQCSALNSRSELAATWAQLKSGSCSIGWAVAHLPRAKKTHAKLHKLEWKRENESSAPATTQNPESARRAAQRSAFPTWNRLECRPRRVLSKKPTPRQHVDSWSRPRLRCLHQFALSLPGTNNCHKARTHSAYSSWLPASTFTASAGVSSSNLFFPQPLLIILSRFPNPIPRTLCLFCAATLNLA